MFCEQFILNGTVGGNNVQKDSVGVDIYETAVIASNGRTTISFLQYIEFDYSRLSEELYSISNKIDEFLNCVDGEFTQIDLRPYGSRSNIFEV